ncbi:putative Flp pilus-assembly TadE/G-like protein [Roseinatronobacter thiooxidans]|uniref:Putative Flp pilus-assembly TadE/G-like protein n=1 Tax=Roseinatronobacter thiooxidans TaxID=121821 RepID=A0A2W7PL14_9RHOB|nr:Tad domain-containing protein [Roseinatronobacter thiooxidans]PZX36216.1 putative Flp pilus-assembly TadE/G-like protein [Roseinatronobacter thiooxidans]
MSQDRPPLALPARPKRAFTRDEDGGILVFWALFLAVAFGFAALTFDIGRVANTQSELQSFADQVALAAAGELDGRSGAITRATAAANGLISRSQTFGDGGAMMSGQGAYTLTFLSALPADDRDPATATTTDPTRARFVQVSVNQRNVQTPFAAINATLVGRAGANAQAQVGATAVAGAAAYACDITPLFFCIPSGWSASANTGQQILLRTGGKEPKNKDDEQDRTKAFWQPGNFGFLDPASLDVDPDGACSNQSGANLYRCLVGAESAITQCIRTDAGVDTLTGQRQGLARAFNTRFDIYAGALNSQQNNPFYRPAPNVLSDIWEPSSGKASVDAPSLPRDICIEAGTCRFGNNDWDRTGLNSYLALYHNNEWPLQGDPNAQDRPSRDKMTRYDLYLAEIDTARARMNDDWPLTAAGYEGVGLPGNHRDAKTPAQRALLDPARRTIIAAAVDCESDEFTGKSKVTPLEYVRVFMTEPVQEMGGDGNGDILVEVVESVGGVGSGSGAASGIYREVIQLYR